MNTINRYIETECEDILIRFFDSHHDDTLREIGPWAPVLRKESLERMLKPYRFEPATCTSAPGRNFFVLASISSISPSG
jgi:hypothetical protein